MRRTASAIVQDGEGWYGLTLTATDHRISDVKVHTDRSLDELKKKFGKQPYGIALDDATGYLFNMTFPFRGRRKINLVIANQLEEMLPFPTEDMVIDFQELDPHGTQSESATVLGAAVPKSVLGNVNGASHVRATSFRSLAALHALRWFGLVPQQNLVFLNSIGNSVVIMMLERQRLVSLRHFYRSTHTGATISALQEIAGRLNSDVVRYFMIAGEDALVEKELIEKTLNISVELLRLGDYIAGSDLPAHYWAGVGTALMALNSNGELSLSGNRNRHFSEAKRASVFVSGALAGLAVLGLGLSSFDYYMKQRTYNRLSKEPVRIFRTVFPKAPPPKDATKALEERIRGLGTQEESHIRSGVGPLEILNEISYKLDPQIDVKLNEFTSDENEFAIAGTSVSFASLDKAKIALQQMQSAGGVELQSADIIAGGQVRFKFKGKL